MAHELQFTDGIADVFSTKETMWHQHGHVLPQDPSFEQALDLCHMEYQVEKQQTFRESGEATRAFVTVRTDTGKELGVVHGQYAVVQNRTAFSILTPLINEGVATIETGGVLRDGADAWLMLKLNLPALSPEVQEAFGGHHDEIKPYALVANNHSGRRGILVALTAVRVVCANTLGAAEESGVPDQIRVVHTDAAEQKLIDAAETLWGDITERYTKIAEAYESMRNCFLIPKEFQKLVVDAVCEDPRANKSWNPDAKMAESVVARYEARKYNLSDLWMNGAGHTGDSSCWEAYNSAVEALDHNEDLWPSRAGVYRTASLLDGTLRQKKTRVFENLMAHVKKHGRN